MNPVHEAETVCSELVCRPSKSTDVDTRLLGVQTMICRVFSVLFYILRLSIGQWYTIACVQGSTNSTIGTPMVLFATYGTIGKITNGSIGKTVKTCMVG